MICTNYHRAIIFTKRTNLLQWFDAKFKCPSDNDLVALRRYHTIRERYAKPRDVKLILLVRYDDVVRCKIKCPINPMPVCDEFTAPSLSAVIKFIMDNGWEFAHEFNISMLK